MSELHAPAATKVPGNKYKLSRRGRQIRTAILLALLITIGNSIAQWSSAQATSSSVSAEFQFVTVRSGETLWQIAEREAPNSDPRDFIAAVVSLNQLGDSEVRAGQRLAVPKH